MDDLLDDESSVAEQSLSLAEGAVALAEQQSAMAQLAAAQSIQESTAEIAAVTSRAEQHEERIIWLTTQMQELTTTTVTQAETLSQLALELSNLRISVETRAPELMPEAPMAPEALMPQNVADVSPEAKMPEQKRKIRRI